MSQAGPTIYFNGDTKNIHQSTKDAFYNKSLKHIHIENIDLNDLDLSSIIKLIRDRNFVSSSKSLPWSLLAKLYSKSRNIHDFENLKIVSLDSVDLNDAQLLKLIQSLNPNYQHSLDFKDIQFTNKTLNALLACVKTINMELFGIQHCTLSDDMISELMKAIENNELRATKLNLNGIQLNQIQLKRLIESAKKNLYIEKINLSQNLSLDLKNQLERIGQRNAWIQETLKKNPHDTLSLSHETLDKVKCEGLTLLMTQGQYNKIETTHGTPSKVALKAWRDVLRTNYEIRRLVFDANNIDKKAEQKVRDQIHINHGIRKIFGGGSKYTRRGVLMAGFLTGQFLMSFVSAIAASYAMTFAALGFFISAGLRILTNQSFYKKLTATKEAHYWDEPSRKNQYQVGQQAAHSYLTWFNPKAWTTPAYLGYTHEKHHIELEVAKRSGPKIS